jgi:hypothetical protein
MLRFEFEFRTFPWVMHETSSQRSRRVEAEDGRVNVTGCIELFYTKIAILAVLGPRGISVFLVFYLILYIGP